MTPSMAQARRPCDSLPDKEARDCVAEAHRKLQKQIAMLTERDKQVVGS